jgi:hypothetical protein
MKGPLAQLWAQAVYKPLPGHNEIEVPAFNAARQSPPAIKKFRV